MKLAERKQQYASLYLRTWKQWTLGSLFSLGALRTHDLNYLCFLGFLLFLVVPATGQRRNA